MAKGRNLFILIPLILDVLVLAVFPAFAQAQGFPKAFLVSLIAMVFPWILFFIFGRVIDSVVSEEIERREAEDNHDFV
jgi:Kef-type K+ transport system membrane component KefB